MSQVFGISHAPAAILIYLAVLIYSPIMAAFGVLGATIATITGKLSVMPSFSVPNYPVFIAGLWSRSWSRGVGVGRNFRWSLGRSR
jgi:urea transporter